MANKSESERNGDHKSTTPSMQSTLMRADSEARLANQDELVKSSKGSIALLQGLLENITEPVEKAKLVREILQEERDVKAALHKKEEILMAMPIPEEESRSSMNSEEKVKNVNEYIQKLVLPDDGEDEDLDQYPDGVKVDKKDNYTTPTLIQQVVRPPNSSNMPHAPQVSQENPSVEPLSPSRAQTTAPNRAEIPQSERWTQPTRSNARENIDFRQHQQQGEQYPNSMDILLMRDQLQALRQFSGEPREWQIFYASYNETKHMLSDSANINRLRRCIVGKAAMAVGDMLTYGSDPDSVVSTLNRIYGNPRMIMNNLFERVEQATPINERKLETVVELACIVRNMCAVIQNLGGPSLQYDHSLINKLERKLSQQLLLEWGRYKLLYHIQWPTIKQFSTFLEFHADVANEVLQNPVFTNERDAQAPQAQRKRPQTVMAHEKLETKPSLSCYFCKGDHMMFKCEKFIKLKVEERRKWVREQSRCFICLNKHMQKDCKQKDESKRRCGLQGCDQKHLRMLHLEAKPPAEVQNSSPEPEVSMHTQLTGKGQVLLRVVPVKLYGKNDKVVSTYAFLDEGSTVSMIEQTVADELGLEGATSDLCMKWTGNTVKWEKDSKRVTVQISGTSPYHKTYKMHNVWTIKNLALPKQSVCAERLKQQYKFLQGVEFETMTDAMPTILIGLKHHKLGLPTDIRQGKWSGPVATKTKLGWIVFGTDGSDDSENLNFHICECETEGNARLDEVYKNFLQAEEAQTNKTKSMEESLEDTRAKAILNDTMVKSGERYEVGLLWRDEMQLPESKSMALRRLQCVERKVAKNPEMLAAYNAKIQEYLHKGYAKRLNDVEKATKSSRKWYIPHFLVFNPNKPNKQRLVFDAAAKVNDVALNDALLVGPDLYCSLPGVLSKFREGEFAVASDIQEMFHRVNIRQADQVALRFLWRDGRDDMEPQEYAMVAMPFGLACSPCIAQWVKNENALKYKEEFPRAVESIINRHYVDDLLDSFQTKEEAVQVCSEITKIQKAAGFELHGWSSNSMEVSTSLNSSANEVNGTKSLDMGQQNEKILGLYWDTKNDQLRFKLSFFKVDQEILQGERAPTKRELLRTMMSVFDPQGMLSHYMFFIKAVFQDACRLKIDWDQVIEASLLERWNIWLAILPKIGNIVIPRNYSINMYKSNVELHIFTDASELAYAAVAYFVINHENSNEVRLVAAKSKVGPTKQRMTIPRMELMGALTGARLAARIEHEHSIKITSRVFWCDNKPVLHWIRGGETWQLKPFVACRVLEILELTKSKEWRYVPSLLNVADDATKWVGEPDFTDQSRWFEGPEFLKRTTEQWPQEKQAAVKEQFLDEIQKVMVVQLTNNHIMEPERFSQWWCMRKALAQALRAIKRMKKDPVDESISVEEYQEATRVLIKQAQADAYNSEISSLKKNATTKIPASSELHILSPYLDEQGLMRMSGRIDKASCVNDWSKRPIILPPRHKITELLVADYHAKFRHGNNETVINELRAKYVIPTMRAVVRRVANACQQCHVNKAKPKIPEEGPLPVSRLSPHEPPFTHTGVDYFGPLEVTIGRRREKRWVALFTCLTIRAVHLEVATDLSADAFIRCLQRFMCRRRVPKFMYSDNGTNFKGAARELQDRVRDIERAMHRELAKEGTPLIVNMKWNFNMPSYTPHMGGCWERLVRSVKVTLKSILKERAPREDTLHTALVAAEHIVNSRPLTYISLDQREEACLTPNNFLLITPSGVRNPIELADESIDLKKQWHQVQEIAEHFKKRWVREYLPTLTRRTKWFEKVKPIEEGDIVIICDGQHRGNDWQRGRVTEIIQGAGNQVRAAFVRTSDGKTKKYPAVRLAVIDVKVVNA